MTPEDPDDLEKLQGNRGQGTAGTGYDQLPDDDASASPGADADDDTELPDDATAG